MELKQRIIRGAAVVGVAAAFAGGAVAQPAGASTTKAGTATGTGVTGTASLTFQTAHKIDPIVLKVSDTACDSRSVKVHLLVYPVSSNDIPWSTNYRSNTTGCGTSASWTTYFTFSSNIAGVRVEACTYNWLHTSCYRSSYMSNPYSG